jgi:hypothetical protein
MPDMGAVGVALAVRVRVVLTVIGDPVEHRALDRQRTHDGEDPLEPRVRLKRAVRQEPVKADGHADRGQQIHPSEDRDIGRVNRAVPEQNHRDQHADERNHDAH